MMNENLITRRLRKDIPSFPNLKYNLHSHTQFCDGRSSMEEILLAARDVGFSVWGFSPHSPIPLESPCNMKKENVGKYLDEIARLRILFPNIHILAGMEVDYVNENFGPAADEVKEYGLDYIIGSVHFIPNQSGEYHDIDGSPKRFQKTLEEHFDNDIFYVVKTFWQQTQKMILAGGFDIIGHIDKIALNASFVDSAIERTPVYQNLANETIRMAIDRGYAIEINTKHWERYGRFFPHVRHWPDILNAGIDMPVNTDTHYADKVESGLSFALSLLSRRS